MYEIEDNSGDEYPNSDESESEASDQFVPIGKINSKPNETTHRIKKVRKHKDEVAEHYSNEVLETQKTQGSQARRQFQLFWWPRFL